MKYCDPVFTEISFQSSTFLFQTHQVSKVTSLSFSSDDPTGNEDFGLNFLRSWRSFLIVLADVEVGSSMARSTDLRTTLDYV